MNPYEPQTPYPAPPIPPAPRRRSSAPLILLLASLTFLLLAFMRFGDRAFSDTRPAATPRPVVARGDLADDEKSAIELFERCSKSVVYVSPLVTQRRRSIFGVYDKTVQTGTGSGFIWDDQGHIVTNFHVIQGATGCMVTLPNGSAWEAELVGALPNNDIAVLRIDAPREDLVPIAIGTSSNLRVGQKVFAIGNPYGLDFTLTTGVISAINRQIRSVANTPIYEVIQTDAAINPGNSGGPLLDSAGRFIGITTAIYSRSGSSAGIGFAVPVDIVNSIVPELIANGHFSRPMIGINTASDSTARRMGLNGVLVISVAPGSGAELAGIRPTTQSTEGRIILGDVILNIDGKPTPDGKALLSILEEYRPNDTVKIEMDRLGKKVTLDVILHGADEIAKNPKP